MSLGRGAAGNPAGQPLEAGDRSGGSSGGASSSATAARTGSRDLFWRSFDTVVSAAGNGALALGVVAAVGVGGVAPFTWLRECA